MRFGFIASIVMCLPAFAQAAAPATARFTYADHDFSLPLPTGYCLPNAEEQKAYDTVAGADPENATMLTLLDCAHKADAPVRKYVLIKFPKSAVAVRMARPALLALMAKEVNTPAFAAAMSPDKLGRKIEDGYQDELGIDMKFDGEIKPRGHDDMCVYLGGTAKVSNAETSYTIGAGGCLTAVAERMVSVNVYTVEATNDGIKAALVTARQIASSMR